MLDIKNAFNITVTNSQLVVPHIYMDDELATWEVNNTQWDLLINSNNFQGDSSYKIQLNRHITTFLYVMVNLDAGEFTIWPATHVNDENLVAVDEENNIVATSPSCGPASGDSSSGSPQGPSNSSSSGLSSGAIAGIAVGAAAGVALASLAAWLLYKKRKRGHDTSPSSTVQSGTELIPAAVGSPDYDRHKSMVSHEHLSSERATMVSSYLGSQVSTAAVSPKMHSMETPGPPELHGSAKPPQYELQG